MQGHRGQTVQWDYRRESVLPGPEFGQGVPVEQPHAQLGEYAVEPRVNQEYHSHDPSAGAIRGRNQDPEVPCAVAEDGYQWISPSQSYRGLYGTRAVDP